jgi:site-specific DNA recombinase
MCVARQIDNARAYAARKGWAVSAEHVFADDGISGAEFARRPGFLRLINALKPRPPFQVLIMSEESRLGREAIETAYALKQIIQAGVRIFFYLEDRERTLSGPTEKLLLSVTAFADELERERARQRVTDTMLRKARAGHVTGGRVFGYDNVVVTVPGPAGEPQRSHVTRKINKDEAKVVRRIFELARDGMGKALIARTLNADGVVSPRPQQRRARGWTPSSVYEVLFRPLYRGEVIYNQTAKRDSWGRRRQSGRPQQEWIRMSVPELQIVSDELWTAARLRLDRSRTAYLERTRGRLCGRPPAGTDAKYLLTGLAECAECGGTLMAESRMHERRRKLFYTCNNHRRRGPAVCASRQWIDMEAADRAVLSTVERQLLCPDIVEAAIDRALDRLLAVRSQREDERAKLVARQESLDAEIKRLTDALAAGVALASIAEALGTREAERGRIPAELASLNIVPSLDPLDRSRIRAELEGLLENWRDLLAEHALKTRHILRELLTKRIRFVPEKRDGVRGYQLEAEATVQPLLAGVAAPEGTVDMYAKKGVVQGVASLTRTVPDVFSSSIPDTASPVHAARVVKVQLQRAA